MAGLINVIGIGPTYGILPRMIGPKQIARSRRGARDGSSARFARSSASGAELLAALSIAALMLALAGCRESAPPLTGGKPVSYWLDASRSADAKARREAIFKLGNVGSVHPEAMPAVIAALSDRDASVRREAILAVVKFGDAAKAAIPTLEDIQRSDRDSRAREYAGKAVRKLQ